MTGGGGRRGRRAAGQAWGDRRIVDFRNQLTHAYLHVDDRIVWLIAQNDVPINSVERFKERTGAGVTAW